MPGSPVLYYGDEIGMGDNIYLGDRDGVRTPMQWTPDRNAGFCTRRLRAAVPAAAHGSGVRLPGRQRRGRDAQPVVVPALAAPHARGAPAAPGVRHRHASRCSSPRTRRCSRTSAGSSMEDGRRDIVLCVNNLSRFAQPVELHAGRPGGQGAGRADRSRAVPADRRAAVLRHAAAVRLLLVHAA